VGSNVVNVVEEIIQIESALWFGRVLYQNVAPYVTFVMESTTIRETVRHVSTDGFMVPKSK
jgi:hypothetical protein